MKTSLVRLLAAVLVFLSLSAPASATESASYQFASGGITRDYLIYRPTGLARQNPVPLVIVLHGGFGSGAQAEKSYHWDAQADKSGFVVVYPDGINHTWNAGGSCCGQAMRKNIDDVSFLTQLIEVVSRAQNIDPKRVYLTGMSNGAAMSYRYACEGTFPIAAIGAVSGSLSSECLHPHAVSIMEIHGLQDQHIPFAGGYGTKGVAKVNWLPVLHTLNDFQQALGCQSAVTDQNGVVSTSRSACASGHDVDLITIADAGHQWPGAQPHSGLANIFMMQDPPSKAIDATATLWAFFESHPTHP